MKFLMYHIDSTVWKWIDGSTLTGEDYSYWNPGEPNSNDDQHFCADMWYKNEEIHGQWDDVPCDNNYRFLCHKPRGKVVLVHYLPV